MVSNSYRYELGDVAVARLIEPPAEKAVRVRPVLVTIQLQWVVVVGGVGGGCVIGRDERDLRRCSTKIQSTDCGIAVFRLQQSHSQIVKTVISKRGE